MKAFVIPYMQCATTVPWLPRFTHMSIPSIRSNIEHISGRHSPLFQVFTWNCFTQRGSSDGWKSTIHNLAYV